MSESVTLDRPVIDLISQDRYVAGVPHEEWRWLRRHAPVYWHDASGFPGFWAITRYDDIIRISRDPNTFQSSKGISLASNPAHPASQTGANKMLIVSDPPRHARLRSLVNKGFTPRRIALLEPHVRSIVSEILDKVERRGECDFVTEIAAILPLAIICEMLGVPRDDWQLMFDWTNRTIGAGDPEYQTEDGDAAATSNRARMEMFGYFMKMMAERRRERRDDLVSIITGAEIEGEQLSDEEILLFCFLLIIAGNETTRNATSGGMLTLIEHPEQYELLRQQPALVPAAVEEILRHVSPVMHMARWATADVELHGQSIKAGGKLVMWYPSANRDESVFPDPDRFDITRTPNEHLAFGIGEHFCLGANLARLELIVMFEELMRRLPPLSVAAPPERLRSNLINGIKHMPVRWAQR